MLPQSPERLRGNMATFLEALPAWASRSIRDLLDHIDGIEERLAKYDRAIGALAREDERSCRLMKLRGIEPTTASALLGSIRAEYEFRNSRQVAAWLGLTS